MVKDDVRKLAEKIKLPTAKRKDSQGLCFVGKVKLPDFLRQRLTPKIGKVILINNDFNDLRREKNGFKSLSVKSSEGWKPAMAEISENCNKIVYKAKVGERGLEITTTRK